MLKGEIKIDKMLSNMNLANEFNNGKFSVIESPLSVTENDESMPWQDYMEKNGYFVQKEFGIGLRNMEDAGEKGYSLYIAPEGFKWPYLVEIEMFNIPRMVFMKNWWDAARFINEYCVFAQHSFLLDFREHVYHFMNRLEKKIDEL